MIHVLRLTQAHYDAMRRHVQTEAPLEACGLMAGKHARVQFVIEMWNQAQSPLRYRLDPREQLQAFNWIDSRGLELLGVFHSHPSGPVSMSPTDIAEAGYDLVHVIWSCLDGVWQANGYWLQERHAVQVELKVSKKINDK